MISLRVKRGLTPAELLKGVDLRKRANELRDKLKAATPVDTGEAAGGWVVEGTPDAPKIVNRVSHIEELNNGSSVQAPAHFIERVLLSEADVSPSGTIVSTNPS